MPVGSGGGGSVWSPASVSGLVVWLDFSDTSTITLSSGRIETISNKTGSGSFNASGPGPVPGIMGSRASGLFQGNSLIGLGGALSAFSILIAMRVNSRAGENSNAGPYAFGGGEDLSTGIGRFYIEGISGLSLLTFTDAQIMVVGGVIPASGGTGKTFVNDTEDTDAVTWSAPTGTLHVVGRGDADLLNSDIGEVIVYDTAIADDDLLDLKSYLYTKWGITP